MTESSRQNPRVITEQRRWRASLVRRAIAENGPLLAPLLDRYAAEEDVTWPEIAASLDGSLDQLHIIACCFPPREESFLADAETIARAGGLAVDAVLPLLRRIQVVAAFQEQTPRPGYPAPNYLLAARDHEDERKSDRG